jgi:hypothetical protein
MTDYIHGINWLIKTILRYPCIQNHFLLRSKGQVICQLSKSVLPKEMVGTEFSVYEYMTYG